MTDQRRAKELTTLVDAILVDAILVDAILVSREVADPELELLILATQEDADWAVGLRTYEEIVFTRAEAGPGWQWVRLRGEDTDVEVRFGDIVWVTYQASAS